MEIIIIPLAIIVIFVVFCIIGLILCLRQRKRSQPTQGPVMFPTAPFVPQQNFVMPMQPTNPQLRTPMPLDQPISYPNSYNVNSAPVPQSFPPKPITPNTSPQPDTSPPNLMDRMRQVQILMMEIHRLENESGEQNPQRVQELKQRVLELSNTEEPVPRPVDITLGSRQPPPAYAPRDNHSGERPEHGDGSG